MDNHYPNWQLQSKEVKRYWADNICAKTSILALRFDLMNWKSIGNIYSLGASIVQSLATFNGRSQKILSGYRWVHRPTDSPTDRCKTICPHFSKRDRTKFHWNTKSFYLTGAQPILAQSLCKITVHVTKNVGPKWI